MLTEQQPRRSAVWWYGAAITLVSLAIGFYSWSSRTGTPELDTTPPAGAALSALPKVNEGGQVKITVTRQQTGAAIAFKVVLDTHAIDLDSYDLRELATLRVDGNEIRAAGWDAPQGGHHREGTLLFPDTAASGPVELVIRDVAGVPERSFRWP